MSNCRKPEDHAVNPWWHWALAVPAMVADCFVSIAVGVGSLLKWAFLTSFGRPPSKE